MLGMSRNLDLARPREHIDGRIFRNDRYESFEQVLGLPMVSWFT